MNSGYFTWRPIYIFIISRSFFLKIKNVSDKSSREIQNTHFVFRDFFYDNRTVYLLMWKKYGRNRDATHISIIRRMHFACWIPKATNTHSEYVILIAPPLQQWLHERASMLPLRKNVLRKMSLLRTKSVCRSEIQLLSLYPYAEGFSVQSEMLQKNFAGYRRYIKIQIFIDPWNISKYISLI